MGLVDICPPWVLLHLDFGFCRFLFGNFLLGDCIQPISSFYSSHFPSPVYHFFSFSFSLTAPISSLSFCEQTHVYALLILHDFIAFDYSPFPSPSFQAGPSIFSPPNTPSCSSFQCPSQDLL